jgi:hypothetical protein
MAEPVLAAAVSLRQAWAAAGTCGALRSSTPLALALFFLKLTAKETDDSIHQSQIASSSD